MNKYGPILAYDLDLNTYSSPAPGSDSRVWLMLILEEGHCVQKVFQYVSKHDPERSWTCTDNICNCEGNHCHVFTLTVSTIAKSVPESDLPPVPDCKYGDTVTLLFSVSQGYQLIHEIAVIGKKGKPIICI